MVRLGVMFIFFLLKKKKKTRRKDGSFRAPTGVSQQQRRAGVSRCAQQPHDHAATCIQRKPIKKPISSGYAPMMSTVPKIQKEQTIPRTLAMTGGAPHPLGRRLHPRLPVPHDFFEHTLLELQPWHQT